MQGAIPSFAFSSLVCEYLILLLLSLHFSQKIISVYLSYHYHVTWLLIARRSFISWLRAFILTYDETICHSGTVTIFNRLQPRTFSSGIFLQLNNHVISSDLLLYTHCSPLMRTSASFYTLWWLNRLLLNKFHVVGAFVVGSNWELFFIYLMDSRFISPFRREHVLYLGLIFSFDLDWFFMKENSPYLP